MMQPRVQGGKGQPPCTHGYDFRHSRSSLLFTMTGAYGISGGIATLNRNVLHALISLASEAETGLTVFSFLEREADRPSFLPAWVRFKAFRGRKPALAANLLRCVSQRPVFCFDHVTLALPLLPLAATGLVQTVIFAHGSESWRRVTRTNRWSFQSAALCLTNSHYTLDKMRERIPKFNGVACPLGLSPDFPLNPTLPAPPQERVELRTADGETRTLGDRVLLLVGRMHPAERQKGRYALLRVLPALLQKYPDVQLVFPGPGDDRANLRRLAQQSGVGGSVFLTGHVPVRMLQRLYHGCYAYVMPSRQEGFGLTYLEAMNYGKPCVGCFNDGAEDVIVHGETGLLVHDPDDPQELLTILRALLDNPECARAMGRQGFQRLHQNFTAQHVQYRIKHHITTVLETNQQNADHAD